MEKNSEGAGWKMQIQLQEQDGLRREGRMEKIRGVDSYCIITKFTPKDGFFGSSKVQVYMPISFHCKPMVMFKTDFSDALQLRC